MLYLDGVKQVQALGVSMSQDSIPSTFKDSGTS